MWDGDAPNVYLGATNTGGCNSQTAGTDDLHCASNYHGSLRMTNNELASGETFMEVEFNSPV